MRQGDARAFAEFLDCYGGQVHRLARRFTRSEADAEDLTQEIFVDLCRSVLSFRGEAALSTYVYRVAMNHCLKHRSRQRPESLPLDEALLPHDAAVSGRDSPAAADPARHVARQEMKSRIDAALADLSPEHRDVVVLHELHGLTYAECAQVFGVPVGTVKSRLSNAFRRLRDRLGGYVLGTEGESVSAVPAAAAAASPLQYAADSTTRGKTRP